MSLGEADTQAVSSAQRGGTLLLVVVAQSDSGSFGFRGAVALLAPWGRPRHASQCRVEVVEAALRRPRCCWLLVGADPCVRMLQSSADPDFLTAASYAAKLVAW